MLDIAYSPCPNDTFCFDAWVHGKIDSCVKPRPTLADIQQLNAWAYEKRYPVTKVSTYCLGNITKDYLMLPSGAAISPTGPKLIAQVPFDLSSMKGRTVAIPGLDTTAYLLFRILFGDEAQVIPCRYDEILSCICKGEADIGLIIHETRFIFQNVGLIELADLGTLYTERYHCPIPLGVIAARRDLPSSLIEQISSSIEESVHFALLNPASSKPYVLSNAQETDENVIKQHIETYVNQETLHMSKEATKAINTFFELAIDHALLPKEARLAL
ncbi:MAG: 1,4-dihydroxy-6-naphthoate synthase [Verrucomicrobia bacterium]|nr:1,4-dihydroxy-6-naphthoate synthase [Verrucomicrobiota bacterium]